MEAGDDGSPQAAEGLILVEWNRGDRKTANLERVGVERHIEFKRKMGGTVID